MTHKLSKRDWLVLTGPFFVAPLFYICFPGIADHWIDEALKWLTVNVFS